MIMLSLFLLLVSCKEGYTAKKAPAVPSAISVASDETSVSVVKGDTYRLQAKVLPENAANKRLSFSSSAEEIASVNPDGLITAHKTGDAVITIRAANGVQKAINLTVTPEPVPVTNIEFEAVPPASLIIGDTYKLKAKVEPDNATDKSLTYAANNNNAAVAPDGMVTAQSEGSVIITVASKSAPSKTKTATIEIKKKPQIKYEEKQAVMPESAAGTYTFEVQTIDGKLDYEPCFTISNKDKLPWITGAPTISSRTDPDKDVISFTCTENKTVWNRRAYIKFWDKTAKTYVKNADGKDDLTVNIIQKKNENPVVHYKWVKGINAPTADQKEIMPIIYNSTPTGDYYEQPYVFKWNETADTNFYNARKLSKLRKDDFPHDYFVIEGIDNKKKQGTDLSQCWAKTASNMLHWWFEQNKDYIEQYKQKAAIEAWKRPLYKHDYIRGLTDKDEGKKSDIANIFRVYTHDKSYGGYIEDGLTWYLYKRDGQKTLGSIYPGLFNDVFTFDTKPINTERCETKKEFERIMNEAFDKGRAIGLFWKGSKGRLYQHAVTCWGAAYDEENNIICLYIAESNLTEPALYPYGVQYRGNIYDEPEQNRAYMFNYYLSKLEDIYVDSITTLDLGEEQWKAWLAAH